MIDRPAAAKEFFDAFIAGDVRGDCDRVQFFRNLVQPLDVAGRYNDIGAFSFRHFGGR